MGSGWQVDWDVLLDAAEYALANDAGPVVEFVTRFISYRDYNNILFHLSSFNLYSC